MLNIEAIARVCHEANRTYCKGLKDYSQLEWEHAPEWQKDSAILGVAAIAQGTIKHPRDSHMSWMKQKLNEGWTYGPDKDPVRKTHPCIKPWEELPEDQRRKDVLFMNVAKALLEAIPT
jgi:hypothetical protein